MRDRRIWLVIVVIFLSMVGSLGVAYYDSDKELSFVVDSYADGVNMYVIDDDGTKISVLKATPEGRIAGGIYLNKIQGENIVLLDHLSVDGDTVYIYQRKTSFISNRVVSEGVYICNFRKGKLELFWERPTEAAEETSSDTQEPIFVELPDGSLMEVLPGDEFPLWALTDGEQTESLIRDIRVVQGELIFLTVEDSLDSYTARAVVNKVDPEDSSPLRVAAVKYDKITGFTDLYYAKNGSLVFTTSDGRIMQTFPGEKQPVFQPDQEADFEIIIENDTADIDIEEIPSFEDIVIVDIPEFDQGQDEIIILDDNNFPGQGEFEMELIFDNFPLPEGELQNELPFFANQPEMPFRNTAPSLVRNETEVADRLIEVLNFLTENPGVFINDPDLQPLQYEEIQKTRLINFSNDGKDSVYFMDLNKNGLCAIDLNDGNLRSIIHNWGDLKMANGSDLYPSDFRNLHFQDDDFFTATVIQEEVGATLVVFENSVGKSYSMFTQSMENTIFRAVLYWGACMLFLLLMYILAGLCMLLCKGRISIFAKLIAVAIPVVVVGLLVLQNTIGNILMTKMLDNQYKELFLISRQQIGAIEADMDRIFESGMNEPYKNLYQAELANILHELPRESRLIDSANNEGLQQIYYKDYHWLHRVEFGILVTMFCDEQYIGVPVEFLFREELTDILYKTMDSVQAYRGEYSNEFGEWIVLSIPITDEFGKIVAVMESGITITALKYTAEQSTKQLHNMILVVIAILLLLLGGVLLISLMPLKTLKTRMQDIISGQQGVQVKIRGNDEVAETCRIFNQMSTEVEFQVSDLINSNRGYSKFVPKKLFNIMHKSSANDLRRGDRTQRDLTILSMSVANFEKTTGNLTGEERFELINQIISKLTSKIDKNGGVVEKYTEAGLTALYPESSEQAITTAISACQATDVINTSNGFGPNQRIELASGISHGPATVGIVGQEEHFAAITISEQTNLSNHLSKIAPKYGSRILATAFAINEIEGFEERYSARFIGFLYVEATNKTEKLYDLFDGDREESKHLKKQTKGLFEKGVNLYCAKEFYEARQVFIEVLKQYNGDKAAKEYIYLCDRYSQLGNTSEVQVEIEKIE